MQALKSCPRLVGLLEMLPGKDDQKPADSVWLTKELFRILEVSVLRACWGFTAPSGCLVQSGVPSQNTAVMSCYCLCPSRPNTLQVSRRDHIHGLWVEPQRNDIRQVMWHLALPVSHSERSWKTAESFLSCAKEGIVRATAGAQGRNLFAIPSW